ncbi:sulfurtransferase [Mycobacterium sp. GA-2829]|uniref:sulfurtransferase n=1 Tax=Mycobacterium sp. GA-2829 TaxID=1772283 RepID=UPI00073FFF40|nr:rhodanese-like domain-containing protein [Mycobacterium sp. GA-2829]KUI22321.1 sulfurtransferase [Mycobacterium sp. GA-2829]
MTARVFVAADTLAARLAAGDDVRVLEVRRDDTAPVPGHIPGAVPVSLVDDLARPGAPATAGRRPLPDIADLQRAVRRWGIGARTAVVVYDHDLDFASARGWWVLRWAGLDDVTILDGGWPAWRRAGHPAGGLAGDLPEGDATLRPGGLPQLDADHAARLADAGALIDARGADAFDKGHIPGARNVSSAATLTADGTLADADVIRGLYGLDSGEVPGLYCGGGVAGAHAVAVLAHHGVTAPLFVGSFSAWSADPQRPVETRTGLRTS